jgi:hypothetical protein
MLAFNGLFVCVGRTVGIPLLGASVFIDKAALIVVSEVDTLLVDHW